jgi:hypothetical protein
MCIYMCIYTVDSLSWSPKYQFEVRYIIFRAFNGSVQAIWNQEATLGLRAGILHYVPPPCYFGGEIIPESMWSPYEAPVNYLVVVPRQWYCSVTYIASYVRAFDAHSYAPGA